MLSIASSRLDLRYRALLCLLHSHPNMVELDFRTEPILGVLGLRLVELTIGFIMMLDDIRIFIP